MRRVRATDTGAGRTGRRPGHRDTRGEILRAAREVFARQGFAGGSVRRIAAEAGCDPALVHHYFGTKEALFAEAVALPIRPRELIADIFSAGLDAAPERLTRTFVEVWDDPATGPALVGFLRSALTEEQRTALAREMFVATVGHTAGAVLEQRYDRAEAQLRLTLVASQLYGMVLVRSVLRLEPLASLPPGEVVAAVTPVVSHYLLGPLAGSPRTPAPRPRRTP